MSTINEHEKKPTGFDQVMKYYHYFFKTLKEMALHFYLMRYVLTSANCFNKKIFQQLRFHDTDEIYFSRNTVRHFHNYLISNNEKPHEAVELISRFFFITSLEVLHTGAILIYDSYRSRKRIIRLFISELCHIKLLNDLKNFEIDNLLTD